MKTPIHTGVLQSDLDCAHFKPINADLSDYAGVNITWNSTTKQLDSSAVGGGGAVTSVFTRTGAIVAATNDYTFAQIGSKPTTLSGYGITDARTITASDAAYAPISHTHTFASLTSPPTTLSGYGITDAQPLDGDLTAIAALAGTNTIYYRSASNTWTAVTMGSNMTFSGGTLNSTLVGGGGGTVTSIATTSPITGGTITNTGTIALDVSVDFAFTNGQTITVNDGNASGVTYPLIAVHNTTGTPANGIGSGVSFGAETSTTPSTTVGLLSCVLSDVTNATRTAYLDFALANSGANASKARLHGSGGLVVGTGFATDPGAGYISATTGFKIGSTELKDATQTLTNKRITPRVTQIASNATWSPSADTDDIYEITAQAAAVTTISNPSGTPVDGQKLIIRVKDNGTARALTWSGSQWRASSDLALPSTTILSKTLYLGFIYNSSDTKWDLLALLNNF